MKDIDKSVDDLFKNFEAIASKPDKNVKKYGAPVTTWLPADYKERYDRNQAKTDRRFGKLMKALLMYGIDRFDKIAS